jgi:hypothetical protein
MLAALAVVVGAPARSSDTGINWLSAVLPKQDASPSLPELDPEDGAASELDGEDRASELLSFLDYVHDASGNMTIPTSFGRRQEGGCECRLQSARPYCTSRQARDSLPTDNENNVPYCLSTYDDGPKGLRMWEEDTACELHVAHVTKPFGQEEEDVITKCLTPDRSSPHHPPRTMFVIGDTHVGALMPALVLAARGTFQIRHVSSNGVGIFPHDDNTVTNLERFVNVYNHILSTLHKEMVKDDVVVVPMWAHNWLRERGAIALSRDGRGVEDVASTPVEMMLKDLLQGIVEPARGKLVIIGEWPYFTGNSGYFTPPSGDPYAPRNAADVKEQAVMQRLVAPLAKTHAALHYLSLLPLFCGRELEDDWVVAPEGACGWNIPGTAIPAYSNANHLSTVGAIYLWPFLCDAMHDGGGWALPRSSCSMPHVDPVETSNATRSGRFSDSQSGDGHGHIRDSDSSSSHEGTSQPESGQLFNREQPPMA